MKILKKIKNASDYKKAIKIAKKLQASGEKGLKLEKKLQTKFNMDEATPAESKKLVEVVKQNYKNDSLKIDQYIAIEKYRNGN